MSREELSCEQLNIAAAGVRREVLPCEQHDILRKK